MNWHKCTKQLKNWNQQKPNVNFALAKGTIKNKQPNMQKKNACLYGKKENIFDSYEKASFSPEEGKIIRYKNIGLY